MTSYARAWAAADMTMRDYFAAQALGGIIANYWMTSGSLDAIDRERFAHLAYLTADAMLEEREKARGQVREAT